MRVLVDTNIPLRSAQPSHLLCLRLLFCSQNIAEFWNVATRPIKMNGLGFSKKAIEEIAGIESLLTLLPDIPAIYPAWNSW